MKNLVFEKTQNMVFLEDVFSIHYYSIYIYVTFFTSFKIQSVIATECYSRNLYEKKGNIFFVNTVNIENTVNTVNTANNKNNILMYLTLPMDRSLPVEFKPQIDFENTRDEDVDETSRTGYVDYSERSFNDLFNIPGYNNIDEHLHNSSSDSESDTGTKKVRLVRCIQKRGKEKIFENGQRENQNQN